MTAEHASDSSPSGVSDQVHPVSINAFRGTVLLWMHKTRDHEGKKELLQKL